MFPWNLKQPFFTWMFGETTIFYVKIWNHPTETTMKKGWLFRVPGHYVSPPLFYMLKFEVFRVKYP